MKYPDLCLKGTERVAPRVESHACVPGPDPEVMLGLTETGLSLVSLFDVCE